jgi:hypothetical protein
MSSGDSCSFGGPAISAYALTRGFASPPHDGFAFSGEGLRMDDSSK